MTITSVIGRVVILNINFLSSATIVAWSSSFCFQNVHRFLVVSYWLIIEIVFESNISFTYFRILTTRTRYKRCCLDLILVAWTFLTPEDVRGFTKIKVISLVQYPLCNRHSSKTSEYFWIVSGEKKSEVILNATVQKLKRLLVVAKYYIRTLWV